jgi:hypothetical protein
MATEGGPNIITDGLVFSVDPKNTKSYQIDDPNILKPKLWSIGTGNMPGFGSDNGSPSENHRIIGTDPYGNDAVIWEARPDSSSGADGGWNTNTFSIDNTKLYRFSTWVKRTVYNDGRFYFGTRGYGSTNGVLRRDNGTNTSNPYYYISSDPPTIGQLPQNEWVLVVGHNWPAGSGTGAEHPNSGRYTTSVGKYGNITRDYVWRSETTSSAHRSYLYYSSQTTPRQQWVYPRVDIVDGNEPSIDDLLYNRVNNVNLIDRSGNNNNAVFINNPTVSSNAIEFDGSDKYIKLTTANMTQTNNRTIILWVKLNNGYTSSDRVPLISYAELGTFSNRVWIGVEDNNFKMHGWGTNDPQGTSNINDQEWHHLVWTYDTNTQTFNMYVDGNHEVVNFSQTEGGVVVDSNNDYYIGAFIDTYSSFPIGRLNGSIGICNIYNKVLSTEDVTNHYNGTKSRFGL